MGIRDKKDSGPADVEGAFDDTVSEIDVDDIYVSKGAPKPQGDSTAPMAQGPGKHTPTRRVKTEGRVLQALALVVVGGVLLLNTTGSVDWSIWWNLVRLWPVWLIAIGFSIIFGWSRWSRFAGHLLFFLALVFILAVSVAADNPPLLERAGLTLPAWVARLAAPEGGAERISKTFVVKKAEAPDVTSRRISLAVSFGDLSLSDDESDRHLLLLADYPEGVGEPHLTKSVSGGSLEILFETGGGAGSFWGVGKTMPVYDLTAGVPTVRTDLVLDIGAGKGTVHLSRLSMGKIEAEAGTGELEMTLEEGTVPADGLRVKVGAGKVKLVIPASVGYKIAYSVGVGSISVEGTRVGVAGGGEAVHTSSNYSAASKTVRIDAEVGAGSFEVLTKP